MYIDTTTFLHSIYIWPKMAKTHFHLHYVTFPIWCQKYIDTLARAAYYYILVSVLYISQRLMVQRYLQTFTIVLLISVKPDLTYWRVYTSNAGTFVFWAIFILFDEKRRKIIEIEVVIRGEKWGVERRWSQSHGGYCVIHFKRRLSLEWLGFPPERIRIQFLDKLLNLIV